MDKRNSGIELLKVIAMAMIVLSHAIPVEAEGVIDLGVATTDMQSNIIRFINCFGNIGNNIFVVCSAWFLLDSKKCI